MSAISSADFQPMTTVTPLGLCQPSPLSSSLSCTSPPAHTFNLHVLTTGTGGSHKIARDSLIHSSKDVFQFDDVDSVKTTHSFFRRLSPSSSTQSDSTQRSSSVVAPPPAHVNTIHGNANGTTNTITIVSNSNSSGSSSHTKEQHKSNNKKSKSNGKPPNANVANASGSKKKKFLNAKQSISNLITPIFRGTGGHAGKPVSPLVITPLANALSSSNILIDSRCITKLPDQRITRDAPSVASASAVEAAAAAASADSGSLQRSSTFTRHLNSFKRLIKPKIVVKDSTNEVHSAVVDTASITSSAPPTPKLDSNGNNNNDRSQRLLLNATTSTSTSTSVSSRSGDSSVINTPKLSHSASAAAAIVAADVPQLSSSPASLASTLSAKAKSSSSKLLKIKLTKKSKEQANAVVVT